MATAKTMKERSEEAVAASRDMPPTQRTSESRRPRTVRFQPPSQAVELPDVSRTPMQLTDSGEGGEPPYVQKIQVVMPNAQLFFDVADLLAAEDGDEEQQRAAAAARAETVKKVRELAHQASVAAMAGTTKER